MWDSGRNERHSSLVGEAEQLDAGGHVRGDVAVGQHHALGVAGGARGIDQRGEVVRRRGQRMRRASRGAGLAPRGRGRAARRSSARPVPARPASNAMMCAQAPAAASRIARTFSSWAASRRTTATAPRVAQDVLDLPGGQRGIDRDVGAAGGEAGVVGDGPLGPVLRQDRDPVAAPHAQLPEAEAAGPGPARRARGSSGGPAAVALGRAWPPAGAPNALDGLEVELGQGARAWAPLRGTGR